jgi:hypothetical protein
VEGELAGRRGRVERLAARPKLNASLAEDRNQLDKVA